MARVKLLVAFAGMALLLSACAAGASTSARAPQTTSAPSPRISIPATGATLPPDPADALGMLRQYGARITESTTTSRIDAAAAVRKTSWIPLDSTTTVITVDKVRLTDAGQHDRLVWVVGVSPVRLHLHGPPGSSHSAIGRIAVVIDANTGEWLEQTGGNLPRPSR